MNEDALLFIHLDQAFSLPSSWVRIFWQYHFLRVAFYLLQWYVVDYKKAYDMVPHSCGIESFKMAQAVENIITFLQKSMVNWKIELTSYGETIALVDIRRGIIILILIISYSFSY